MQQIENAGNSSDTPSSPDIVAELDRKLDECWKARQHLHQPPGSHEMMLRRVRAEIVALRTAGYEAIDNQCRDYIREKRNEALEEAAQFVERNGWEPLAAAIRKLKDGP